MFPITELHSCFIKNGSWFNAEGMQVCKTLRLAIEQDFHCAMCNCEWTHYVCATQYSFFSNNTNKSTIDHILPRSYGGKNCPTNLRLVCEPCNKMKGNLFLSDYKELCHYTALEAIDSLLKIAAKGYDDKRRSSIRSLFLKLKAHMVIAEVHLALPIEVTEMFDTYNLWSEV